MEWTPLISSAMFTGVTADVNMAAAGVITIAMIILGVGLLLKILS